MRTILLALALCACSAAHVTQPSRGTAVATVVAVEVESPQLSHEPRARIDRAVCVAVLAEQQDVWFSAANAGHPAEEFAAMICEKPGVTEQFHGLASDAEIIDATARAMTEAAKPCPMAQEIDR